MTELEKAQKEQVVRRDQAAQTMVEPTFAVEAQTSVRFVIVVAKPLVTVDASMSVARMRCKPPFPSQSWPLWFAGGAGVAVTITVTAEVGAARDISPVKRWGISGGSDLPEQRWAKTRVQVAL